MDVATKSVGPRRLEPEARAFAHHLKALLILRDIKPAELSRRSGIAQPLLSRFLDGTRRPDLNTLIRLANGLNVSLDELVSRKWPRRGAEPVVVEPGYEQEFLLPKQLPPGHDQQPGEFASTSGKSRRTKRRTQ